MTDRLPDELKLRLKERIQNGTIGTKALAIALWRVESAILSLGAMFSKHVKPGSFRERWSEWEQFMPEEPEDEEVEEQPWFLATGEQNG